MPEKHTEEQLWSFHSRSITHSPLWTAFQCHFPPFLGIDLRLLHGFLPYSLSLSLLRNHTYHNHKHFPQFLLFYKLSSSHTTQISLLLGLPVGAPTTRWAGLQGLALVMLTWGSISGSRTKRVERSPDWSKVGSGEVTHNQVKQQKKNRTGLWITEGS